MAKKCIEDGTQNTVVTFINNLKYVHDCKEIQNYRRYEQLAVASRRLNKQCGQHFFTALREWRGCNETILLLAIENHSQVVCGTPGLPLQSIGSVLVWLACKQP